MLKKVWRLYYDGFKICPDWGRKSMADHFNQAMYHVFSAQTIFYAQLLKF